MAEKTRVLHKSFRPCRDYIIALVPLMIMAVYLYGARPLIIFFITLVTALVCDLLVCLMRRMPYDVSDISSYMFALIFVLMLPASVRYEIVIIGTAFTVLIGKHAFGGYEKYPFHPSAFGFAFTSVCFASEIYRYPQSFSKIGIGADSGAVLYGGVASSLKYGGVPAIDRTDLFLGNYPGPMGTTFCLIIIACMILFIVHRTIYWKISVVFLATCALWAAVFPRIQTGVVQSVTYELLSGALIFAAVFIVPEPSVTPSKSLPQIIYAALLGIVSMAFRTYGAYETGVCFALLIMSPLSSFIERTLGNIKKKPSPIKKGGRLV